MKKIILATLLLCSVASVFGQSLNTETDKHAAIDAGVLMGGGSLIGFDLEVKPFNRLGMQFGAGISSFGGGLNYHFNDRINSSYLSLQYWHQGFGDYHYASYIGPMFVFRLKKILQAGIGLGYILDKGPTFNTNNTSPVFLLYNVGVYFPF